MRLRKILCPTDFSDSARSALEAALELARSNQGEVTLLHVFNPPVGYSQVMGPSPGIEITAIIQTLERELERWRSEAAARGVKVSATSEIGRPGHTITLVAQQGDYDLIVMGTHGRTGLSRLLLGSVAGYVVRHASCPVLTTHARAETAEAAHPER